MRRMDGLDWKYMALGSWIKVWLVALLLIARGANAGEGAVFDFNLRADGDIVRVQLETRVGVFNGAALANRGQEVVIELKGVEPKELSALIERFKQPAVVVRGVHVLPGQGNATRLLIQLTTPAVVLDETIVAGGRDRSRWELVLGPAAQAAEKLPVASVPPSISSIALVTHEGRLDLLLTGSSSLVAEVSFEDKPPVARIDLPGVAHKDLLAVVQTLRTAHPMIRGIMVRPIDKKSSRLLINLAETADLVDGAGAIEGETGRILISLAPDAAPSAKVDVTARLGRIRVDELVGRLTLMLPGVDGSRINAYTLDDPPQLVIDFLGWSPRRLESAAAEFLTSHPVVRSARVESTRLGSGRLIFELSGPSPLIAKTVDSQSPGRGEPVQQMLTVALRKPLPGEEIPESERKREDATPDLRRDLHDRARPVVVIRPVQLEQEAYWVKKTPPAEPQKGISGLMSLLKQALSNDPKYQAAKSDLDANQEALPQARAGNLPTANFDYQHKSIYQNILRASNPSFSTGDSDYPSKDLTLTITQPVFKVQALVKVNQASVAVEQAQVNLIASEQDLILRLASAYLNLLAAKDARELAKAEREVNGKQFELAQARLESGLGTITQLHDTEARFALTEAREIDASNKYDDAIQGIKEIIGIDLGDIQGFTVDFDAAPPQPASVDAWVQAAMEQNLALQSRNLALEIARLEIQRQQAGYLPTLNLVSTVSRQDSDGSLYGDGQKVDNVEVGIKLSVPIFEGGMTLSLVREAYARRDKASQEREQELRRTERMTRSTFQSVEASARSLAALRKAVVAQDGALQARVEGFKAGVGNILTVVDAYRMYYSAKRDYLQARYDYLVNRLRLKQAVGTLSRTDLEDLGALLKTD
ncbi:MAG: TolC family outer membrane protein [Magnetococcales bacterium]|nr:TolC family outer membrane protein [Magnetococcales bacterium]MBF0347503.1 TolC family outer membrane protein [Magnetococcales bacterium]MBF0631745.1 TolC family outer membrane protein [Magnetococcales bacterium]